MTTTTLGSTTLGPADDAPTTPSKRFKFTDRALREFPRPTNKPQTFVWDTQTRGFGAVIGRSGTVTFRVRGSIHGHSTQVAVTIGQAGRPRPDGRLWDVQLARQQAHILLGRLAAGENPNAADEARRSLINTITLRQALEWHLRDMKKMGCVQGSMRNIERDIKGHLAAWLDRSIHDLSGAVLKGVHDRLTEAGSESAANHVVGHFSAVWNTLAKIFEGKGPFAGRNPASAVTRNSLEPLRRVVEDLPAWYAIVQTLTPVRRDLRLFLLFTANRKGVGRLVRHAPRGDAPWADLERGIIHVPKPKGGKKKAFTLPLSPFVVSLLRRRKAENAILFAPFGGDDGWLFPTQAAKRDASGRRPIIPVADTEEKRKRGTTRVRILSGAHDERRTFLSVAHDIRMSALDRHVFANHSYANHDVNSTYIKQNFRHLRSEIKRIEDALWARIHGEVKGGDLDFDDDGLDFADEAA